VPRHSPLIPPDLRSQLETARLDTLALLRSLDQALVPKAHIPNIDQLFELDADCAEALWALDQPPTSLDFAAMVRDTLVSLQQLPGARQRLREALRRADKPRVISLETAIRAALDLSEAYNDVLGRDPQSR
jgi:hypothetical protein